MSGPHLIPVIGYVVVVTDDDQCRAYGDEVWERRADADMVRGEAERNGMEDPEVYMLVPVGSIPMAAQP